MRTFKEAMRPFLPFVSYFVIFMGWMHWSPSNIMEKEPRMVFLLSGTIFSNISVSGKKDDRIFVIFTTRLLDLLSVPADCLPNVGNPL